MNLRQATTRVLKFRHTVQFNRENQPLQIANGVDLV